MRKTLAVAAKELRQARRDPFSLMMLLGIPTFMLLLYGFALNFDVRHVPLVVQDRSLTQASRDADAEPVCTSAVAAAPEASVAHYWLGVIAFRRGDLSAAAKRFARVLELDPEAGHARKMLDRSSAR